MGCVCGKKTNVSKEDSPKPETLDKQPENSKIGTDEISELSKKPKDVPVATSDIYRFAFYDFKSPDKSTDSDRSSMRDWQSLLKEQSRILASESQDWKEGEEQLVLNLLKLAPRDWVKESISFLRKSHKPGNQRSGMSYFRKALQLNQHFRWLVWALSKYAESGIYDDSGKLGQNLPDLEIPRRLKEWFRGFTYKNVKVQICYEHSPEGYALKSEVKALRVFGVTSEETPSSNVILPILHYSAVGPFLIYAMPVIPENLFVQPQEFNFKCLNKILEHGSLLKLTIGDFYLAYNLSKLLEDPHKIKMMCVIRCTETEIGVSDSYEEKESISVSAVSRILYPSGCLHESEIEYITLNKYGWDMCLYYDAKSSKRNPIASLLSSDVRGDVLLSVCYRGSSMKRIPIAHLDENHSIYAKVQGVKACMATLENGESIFNHQSLEELMHRKGLNLRHQWILTSKCRSDRVRNLIETDILARAVKTLVWHRMESDKSRSFEDLKSLLLNTINSLMNPLAPENMEVSLLLFLSRLKSMREARVYRRKYEESLSRIIEPMKKKTNSYEYYLSDSILRHTLKVAQRAPALFLDALQLHTGIEFSGEVLKEARSDNFFFVYQSLTERSILGSAIRLRGVISIREEVHFSLLKFLENTNGKSPSAVDESFDDWLSEDQIEMINKEEERNSLEMILPADLYSIPGSSLFKDTYEIPSSQVLDEWVSSVQELTKDLICVGGEESVLGEALVYAITERFFVGKDFRRCEELLILLQQVIKKVLFVPPELTIAYWMWRGILEEEHGSSSAEQHYVSALLLMTRLLGDPRGRGSTTAPWQMVAAWKIGQFARENKHLLDAQAADEHFDAVFMGTKQFQQTVGKQPKGKYTSARQEQVLLKHPFEHWSISTDRKIEHDRFFSWFMSHSLPMYQSGALWSCVFAEHAHFLTCEATFSQALVPENGALDISTLNGSVFVWGNDAAGQLGLGNGDSLITSMTIPFPRMMTCFKDSVIKDIAVGSEHCIAIAVDGRCFAWGSNESAQLGLGPDMPQFIRQPTLIKTVSSIQKAACGYLHSLLLSSDGKVSSMGIGDGGVLGHGNTHLIMYPKLIQHLKNLRIVDIKAGGYHSIALTDSNEIYVWGRSDGGQLGLSKDDLIIAMQKLRINSTEPYIHTPTKLHFEMGVRQIACGEAHSLALVESKEVYGWGWGSNGQLGTGQSHDDFEDVGNIECIQYTPAKVKFDKKVKIRQIAAGGLFSVFVTDKSEVFACGMNDFAQLGLENPKQNHTDIPTPTKVDSFGGVPISKVYCGENHAMAVSYQNSEKMTWAWGRSKEGQLGLGDSSHSQTPRPVQLLNNAPVYKMACGRMHSVAVIGDPELPEIPESISEEAKWETVYYKRFK